MAELRVTNTGTIKLFESDDTSSVTIASPASLGGDRTITLPDANVDLTEVNTMPIANLDIDGGTDIGAAITDSDLFIIDDGAGGTNRKTAASRLKTYVGAGAGAFDIANLDIDGGTDIGADIVDADLFIIDDGAGGTNRKTTASRLKSYIGGGLFTQTGFTTISASQTINVDNVFSSTYKNYMVIIEGWSHQNSTSQLYFGFRTGTSGSNADGGGTIGGVSAGRLRESGSDPSFMGNDSQNDSQVRLTTDVYNNEYSSLQMYVFNPYVTSRRSTISGRAPYREGSTSRVGFTDFGHLSISSEQHTGFKIYTQGSFNSGGTITVYGMTNGS